MQSDEQRPVVKDEREAAWLEYSVDYTEDELSNRSSFDAGWDAAVKALQPFPTGRLVEIQNEVKQWSSYNFPNNTPEEPFYGMVEELGELAHIDLKERQKIRLGTDEPLNTQMLRIDAIGDILVYMLDYCWRKNILMSAALAMTWAKVRLRDWRRFPKNGVSE